MPSVRVKRSGGRPYTVIESTPPSQPTALRPESPSSGPAPQPEVRPVSPVQATTNAATPRRRRGTVVSLFGRNTGAPADAQTTLSVPDANSDGRRDGPTEDWRNSKVMDHVMKGRQRATSRAQRSAERLPTTRDGRTSAQSIRTQGNEVPSVNVRLSQDDMDGNIGSMLSLPRDERNSYSNYDDHHHDEIVDHLDVIGTSKASARNDQLTSLSYYRSPGIYSHIPQQCSQFYHSSTSLRLLTSPSTKSSFSA